MNPLDSTMPSSPKIPTAPASPAETGGQEGVKGGGRRTQKILVFTGIAAAIGATIYFLDFESLMNSVTSTVDRLGFWGPVIFVAAYVIATVLFVPGSALTLAAGGLFGVGLGSVYVSVGSTLGAIFAFLLGRHSLRRFISKKIDGNEKFSAIDDAVANEGWKIVGLTRLSPAFPFTLLNYAYGLTKVSLRDYAIASWIGMMPGTVLYVYLGAAGKAAAGSEGKTPGEWALFAVGLAATAAVTIYITKVARRALNEKLDESASTPVAERPDATATNPEI